ncbi:hypothetical protein MSAN_01823100 [Mycena sanguinolenta]|uniref:Uncharacterized protein n=1 Tax=Mycena sanguinolenta TaxID=230812 RepID=A0A8H7CQU4_9AGAR|nr:hypothetical protein MSAN_01823100 [Mycena sanguinolenta]
MDNTSSKWRDEDECRGEVDCASGRDGSELDQPRRAAEFERGLDVCMGASCSYIPFTSPRLPSSRVLSSSMRHVVLPRMRRAFHLRVMSLRLYLLASSPLAGAAPSSTFFPSLLTDSLAQSSKPYTPAARPPRLIRALALLFPLSGSLRLGLAIRPVRVGSSSGESTGSVRGESAIATPPPSENERADLILRARRQGGTGLMVAIGGSADWARWWWWARGSSCSRCW